MIELLILHPTTHDFQDAKTNAGKLWRTALRSLLQKPECSYAYWGAGIEDPHKALILYDWKSNASSDIADILTILKPVLTAPPLRRTMTVDLGTSLHIASSDVTSTYTEVVTLSFPSSSLSTATRKEFDRRVRLFASIAQPMDAAQREVESIVAGWMDGVWSSREGEGNKEEELGDMIKWAGFLRWGSEEQEMKGKEGRGAEALKQIVGMAAEVESWHVEVRRVPSRRSYQFESDSDENKDENQAEDGRADRGRGDDSSQRDKMNPDTLRPNSENQEGQEQTVMKAKTKLSGIR